MDKRKRASKADRLTPCQVCRWPLSQRHHLLGFADYGESDETVQLCANCHELYHLMYNVYVQKTQNKLLGHVLVKLGTNNEAATKLYRLAMQASELERAVSQEVMREIDSESNV